VDLFQNNQTITRKMQESLDTMLHAYFHILLIGTIVVCLFLWFLYGFAYKNIKLKSLLTKAIKELAALQKDKGNITLDDIMNRVMTTPKLQHLWSEYADTLHPQSAPDEFGQERVVRWRQTVLAEAYFNVEALVAVELRTEYFKHQPGIFTGLGNHWDLCGPPQRSDDLQHQQRSGKGPAKS
jgi:hypothetical protein